MKPSRILINLTSPKNKRRLNSAYGNEEMTADPADHGCRDESKDRREEIQTALHDLEYSCQWSLISTDGFWCMFWNLMMCFQLLGAANRSAVPFSQEQARGMIKPC